MILTLMIVPNSPVPMVEHVLTLWASLSAPVLLEPQGTSVISTIMTALRGPVTMVGPAQIELMDTTADAPLVILDLGVRVMSMNVSPIPVIQLVA